LEDFPKNRSNKGLKKLPTEVILWVILLDPSTFQKFNREWGKTSKKLLETVFSNFLV
jgi:hypothetical protein